MLLPIVFARIDDAVRAHVADAGSAAVMLHLSTNLALDTLELDRSLTRAARREAVQRHLISQTEASQRGVRMTLDRFGLEYTPFWISNTIAVVIIRDHTVTKRCGHGVQRDQSLLVCDWWCWWR